MCTRLVYNRSICHTDYNYNYIGQFCQSGSSYSDVQNAVEYPIEVGKWFLNLQFPSSCSGQVIQYDVRFFLSSNDDFTAYVALWEIADIEASYHMVK